LSAAQSRTAAGLFKPVDAQRYLEEYGLVVTVLRVGPGCAPEIREGARVLLPQFAGTVIYDLLNWQETELWMVGDSEVMAVLGEDEG
jgi:hypothetical protein